MEFQGAAIDSDGTHVSVRRPAVVVCHSHPANWVLPMPLSSWSGAQCPPDPQKHGFVYLVGR